MLWMTVAYYMIALMAGSIALNNIYVAIRTDCRITKWMVSCMMVLIVFKYIGVMLFGMGGQWYVLEKWKRTLLFSAMGITTSLFFTIHYLYGKKRTAAHQLVLRLIPLLLFYCLFIVTAKVSIVPSAFLGYEIRLEYYWKLGLGFVQGIVLLFLVYYTYKAARTNRDEEARLRLIFLTFPLVLFLLDGAAQIINIPFLQPLSISEVVSLLATGYGLSYKN
ncbi:hypothetical protein [Geosporobacter ferrireducens]|uniref:Histidine kinase N-terminal 7TM region domain-containing protein n=1 Tax=Geosporobacter ferrireducens TaxID=1424294 RepID=A0A1D8GJG4_9FIRM|nr:hypothetical protein [Geosporobacter ferrireducens]AOT71043.1 hypothetical protein Gferi_16650 [Geosporobacter ferrireducens]MTI58266.1 hypothetical protein [Geosporobacter ferrireducens]